MATLKNTTVDNTGAVQLPTGTTAERPSTPLTGMMRFNTQTTKVEYYNGSSWIEL